MFSMLRGSLDYIGQASVILDVQGIGYEVYVGASMLANTQVNQELKLYVYHHVREDDERLFGFATRDEHDLFVKFLAVDGVGPKVALAIFSTYSYVQICDGLSRGDERFFAAVSGLGKKTAAKIILELKGKVVGDQLSGVSNQSVNNDVVDALVALGFAEHDIFGVMTEIDDTLPSDVQIKRALQKLSTR